MQLVAKTLPDLPPGVSWLSIDEAHKRDGRGVRRIHQLCVERWSYTGLAMLAKPEGCHKPQWFIRSDRVKSAGVVEIAIKPVADPSKLSEEVLCKLGEKSMLFEEWQEKLKAARRFHGPNAQRLTKEQVTQRFIAKCQDDGIKISARTLYRMEKKVEDNGPVALIDGRSIREKTARRDDPFLMLVESKYMTRDALSVTYCYKLARPEAIERGLTIWSLRKVQMHIEGIQPQQRDYVRLGKKEYERKYAQYVERDWEPVRANEQWGSDHHTLDLWVKIGETVDQQTGEVKYRHARPNLTVWFDNASRKVLAWDLYVGDPSTDHIVVSLRRAVMAYGAPEHVYVDNGKDYDSFSLHGRTKAERRRTAKTENHYCPVQRRLADAD